MIVVGEMTALGEKAWLFEDVDLGLQCSLSWQISPGEGVQSYTVRWCFGQCAMQAAPFVSAN
jgi:hypothetical protein